MPDGLTPAEGLDRPVEDQKIDEAARDLDLAAYEPAEQLEKTADIQMSEKVEEAFVAAMPPVETIQTEETLSAESSLDGESHDPADNYSGVDMTQGEVLEDSDLNDQNEATPKGSPEFIMDNKGELDGPVVSSTFGDDYSGVNMAQGEVAQDSDLNNPPDEGENSSVNQDEFRDVTELFNYHDVEFEDNVYGRGAKFHLPEKKEYIQHVNYDFPAILTICNALLDNNLDSAAGLVDVHKTVLFEGENQINLLARMFYKPYIDQAIWLYLTSAKYQPDSWETHFNLGYIYKEKGETLLAKNELLIAKELSPENTKITDLLDEVNEIE